MPASRFGRSFLFRLRTATDQKGYEVKHRRMRFPTMEEYVDFLEELQGDAA